MIRIWFKDGTYLDCPFGELDYWETQPDFDQVEYPSHDEFGENGKQDDRAA